MIAAEGGIALCVCSLLIANQKTMISGFVEDLTESGRCDTAKSICGVGEF